MNLKNKIILIIFAIIVIAFSIYHFYPEKAKASGTPSPTINVSYDNFASVISRSSMIRDLPKNSEVLLKFYKFDLGERKTEKSFLLKSEGIEETSISSSEVVIWLSSKYILGLTNKNLCSTFKKANRAGDLEIETELSSVALAWKFKSMTKYKDCF
jgi:hypothetical protein